MKLLVALALVGLVGAVGEKFIAPIQLDYHNAIGIPTAARIKAAEEAPGSGGGRIVGGLPAALGEYPYMGGLIIAVSTGETSVCGSTLLSNTRAVTAAHCWRGIDFVATQFTVVLGSTRLFSGGTRLDTSDVEIHANFDQWNAVNDIAIIRHAWVSYNENIRNIALATGTDQFVGTWAWSVGFGMIGDNVSINSSQSLSHLPVQVMTNAECAATYGNVTVQDSTLCVATAGGRGVCGGDSGGPLVANNQLIGVTSFSHVNGCQLNYPNGYARVTSFASWIQARL